MYSKVLKWTLGSWYSSGGWGITFGVHGKKKKIERSSDCVTKINNQGKL